MAEAKEFFSAAKHALEEVKNTQREAVYEAAENDGRLHAGKRSCPAVRFRTRIGVFHGTGVSCRRVDAVPPDQNGGFAAARRRFSGRSEPA